MPANVPGGAVHEYLAEKFGGVFEERETRPAVGVAAVSVVGNNPDRLGLLIVNTGAAAVTLGLQGNVTAGLGIVLGASGGSVSLDVNEDYTLVSREFFAVGAAASTLYVLEMNRPIVHATAT